MSQIHKIAIDDAQYPAALREIPDPPNSLYFKGDIQALGGHNVAIVGARNCSPLGRETAESFARYIASCGACVVSGLAHGIDAAAHRGALCGFTAAVLGCGVDRIYPARNAQLAQQILDAGGVILSEYPAGTPPAKHRFPERNRIISGLSVSVLVVEASERSGSLITARMALEQGRDVLAVPGSIASQVSRGCLRLLREGAALVDSEETLGFELDIAPKNREPPNQISEPARELLGVFTETVMTVDELAARLTWPVATVLAVLAEMELDGFVSASVDGYSRRPFNL